VLVAMTLPHAGGIGAARQQHPYGLAASVWTESINLALDIAPKIKAGVVWVNSTNLFDAAAGFGGYRESGFGREGGREGMWEYVKRSPRAGSSKKIAKEKSQPATRTAASALPPIDRTPKLFIAGKQARPDGAYTRRIVSPSGAAVGEAPEGNRKDIRNAVEAAHAAKGWGRATGHNRAQILYYIAENLSVRGDEFAARIEAMTECGRKRARQEVDASIARLFTYGAWADKYDGAVHSVPIRGVAIAMNEPIGVVGIACDDGFPLLGMLSLVAPAVAMGNTTIVVPSQRYPLAGDRLLQRARDLGPAGGRDQHRDRRARRASPRCWPSTTTSRPCGIAAPAKGRRRSSSLGREHEAHLGRLGRARLARSRRRRGTRVPARRHAREEHLGPVRRIDAGQEIIRRKRDGNALERAHIDAFVRGLVDQSWSDAQAAAMAMASSSRACRTRRPWRSPTP
jgi:hypothetical protein